MRILRGLVNPAAFCLCVLTFFPLFTASSLARTPPTLSIVSAYFHEPLVEVKVDVDDPAEEVTLLRDGDVVAMKELGTDEVSRHCMFWVKISKPVASIQAKASFRGETEPVASEPLDVTISDFQPSQPSLPFYSGQMVGRHIRLSGQADERTLAVHFVVNGDILYRQNVDYGENYSFEAELSDGENQVQLVHENAWGESSTPVTTIWNMGDIPKITPLILVDKSEFRLFYIKDGIVQKSSPIAIGTPKTPTLNGYWMIGKKEIMSSPDSAWGVLRLLLYRKGSKRWSGYAIHGTNNPSSIGKMASHGCVRMYNEDVIQLSEIVEMGTTVFVQE